MISSLIANNVPGSYIKPETVVLGIEVADRALEVVPAVCREHVELSHD